MGGLRMRKNPGFKIFLGLLFPFTISQLEFKTKEELELMPQTEEEMQDRDDNHSNSSSSSSSTSSRRSSINANDLDSLSSVEAGRPTTTTTTKSIKKDKGYKTDRTAGETEFEDDRGPPTRSYFASALIAPDSPEKAEDEDKLILNNFAYFSTNRGYDFVTKRRTRPLKLRKKLYEFYAAPITKYFSHSVIIRSS